MTEHEPRFDPDCIDWAFSSELPSGDLIYAAALCRPDQELTLVDLVYSTLYDGYYRPQREALLDKMAEVTYNSAESDDLAKELLVWNTMEVPVLIQLGVVPGHSKIDNSEVIGIVGWYIREKDDGETKDESSK